MTSSSRPLPDRIEVGAPGLAALLARVLGRAPEPLRRRVLQAAFDRDRDAFNRGDLEVVFALFAEDIEYGPPPPLHDGPLLHGRAAVFDFWRAVQSRYDTSTIENLTMQESAPGRFVRRARLQHRSTTGKTLAYTILQTTELDRGRVVRQINVLDPTYAHRPGSTVPADSRIRGTGMPLQRAERQISQASFLAVLGQAS